MNKGRPPVDERKDAVLSVRMTDAEYRAVLARAKAARAELATYVRERLSVNINSRNPAPMQK
jgi:hypothetical protein